MLVLVSFVLVLAAMASLVAGLIGDGHTLIYVSIGCSLAAGLMLVAAVLKGRPDSAKPKAASPPRPIPPAADTPAPTRTWDQPAPARTSSSSTGSTLSSRTSTPEPAPVAPSAPSPAPVPGAAPAPAEAAGANLLRRIRGRGRPAEEAPATADITEAGPDSQPEVDDPMAEPATMSLEAVGVGATMGASDDDFPISNYDNLRAVEVITAIEGLDARELQIVRNRESADKNRFSIMNRIDDRLAAIGPSPMPAWGPDDDMADDDMADDDMADDDMADDLAGEGMPEGGIGSGRAIAVPPVSTSSPARRSVSKGATKKAVSPTRAPVAKARPVKATTKTLVGPKKAPASRKAAAKKAFPVKKATPVQKAAPVKKASTAKRASTAKAAPAKAVPARKATKAPRR